jgi:hypothetical protein
MRSWGKTWRRRGEERRGRRDREKRRGEAEDGGERR